MFAMKISQISPISRGVPYENMKSPSPVFNVMDASPHVAPRLIGLIWLICQRGQAQQGVWISPSHSISRRVRRSKASV